MSDRLQYIAGRDVILQVDDLEAVPTSATVELFHPDTGSLGAASVALLPTATATLTAAAPSQESSLTVDSSAGFVYGDRVLITNTTGRRAIANLIGVATGALLIRGLPFRLESGATVEALKVAFNAGASLARARAYRALWTIDGVARFQLFDVVRQPFKVSVNPKQIEGLWPGQGSILGQRPDWRDTALFAAQRELEDWLVSKRLEPDLVKDPRAFSTPAAHFICWRLALASTAQLRLGDIDRIKEGYTEAMERPGRSLYWYDANDNDLRDAPTTDPDGNTLTQGDPGRSARATTTVHHP